MSRAKGMAEMSDFLLKGDYAAELSKTSAKELDAYRMEKIFYQKLSERFSFLLQITSGKIEEALEEYYKKFEVENIKRIIRATHGKEKINEDQLVPVPRKYQTVNLSALVEADTAEEMVGFLKETPYRGLKDRLGLYVKYNNPLLLEAQLEKIYYDNFWAKLEKMPDNGEVKKLIGTEIDLKNLLYIFSFKHMKMEQQLLGEMMINVNYRLDKNLIRQLINGSYEAIPGLLTWPPYIEVSKKAADLFDKGMLTDAENVFSQYLYSYAETVALSKPNDLVYVFAYLHLCVREAKNLTTLTLGKQLKLSEERILGSLFL
jgi:vacuolar-type H+-ATPase subunit C/Vma6